MPRDPRRESLLPGSTNFHTNAHAQLISRITTEDEFRNFVTADASHVTQAFEAYQWLRNEYQEGVESYNQLLEDKKAAEKDNNRLRNERDEQKERVLRMEGALTYVEGQVAELQSKQHRQPPPPPPPSNQAMNSDTQATPTQTQAMPPPAMPSESTSTGESKKIVVVPDPPIFNGKEKDISYDH